MVVADTSRDAVLKIFNKYDKNGSRGLDVSELRSLCYDLGYHMSVKEREAAVMCMDRKGTGEISFSEFYDWWKQSSQFKKIDRAMLENMKYAVDLFKKHDKNMNGVMEAKEFQSLTQELGRGKMTIERAQEAVKELDKNRDGVINFNEYIDWLGWFEKK